MKTGISRPTHNLAEAREMLAEAEKLGFSGVQLKPHQYDTLEGGLTQSAFAGAYGPRAKLACGGLISYCGGDISRWELHLLPVFDFAHSIAADHICICAGVARPPSGKPAHEEAARTLMALGKIARTKDLRLSLHNHADSIFESREDILRMAELLDPEYCGLTMDTAHFAKAGCTEIETLVPQLSNHLLNVHLKDLDEKGQFCPLGRGRLDLSSIIRALKTIGYEQWLIVDDESMDLPMKEAFAISRAYLNEVL